MNKQNDAIKKNKEETRKSIESGVKLGKAYGNTRLNTILLVHDAIDKGYIKLEYIDTKKDPNGHNKKALNQLKRVENKHIRYFRDVYTKEYLGVTWTTANHKNHLDALRDAIMGAITLFETKALAKEDCKHLEGTKGDRIWIKTKFVTENNPDANPNNAKGNIALSFSQLEETSKNYWSRRGKGSGGTAVKSVDGMVEKLNITLANDMDNKVNPFMKSTIKTISLLQILSTTMNNYIRKKTLREESIHKPEEKIAINS